jgi:hypothetical protein
LFKDPEKREYIWPLLMDKLCPVYSLTDSMFVVTKDKECTARVATWKQYGINNCYTLEMSVCGAG